MPGEVISRRITIDWSSTVDTHGGIHILFQLGRKSSKYTISEEYRDIALTSDSVEAIAPSTPQTSTRPRPVSVVSVPAGMTSDSTEV
jgi:hypothetical protein